MVGPYQRPAFKTPDLSKLQTVDNAELYKSLAEKISQLETTLIKISKKNWVERNPVAFAIIMSVAAALIAAIVSQIAHIHQAL